MAWSFVFLFSLTILLDHCGCVSDDGVCRTPQSLEEKHILQLAGGNGLTHGVLKSDWRRAAVTVRQSCCSLEETWAGQDDEHENAGLNMLDRGGCRCLRLDVNSLEIGETKPGLAIVMGYQIIVDVPVGGLYWFALS